MNRKILKPIKISAIAVGALIVVFLAVVTIAVNFVFTPSRLTPVVLRVANQSMSGTDFLLYFPAFRPETYGRIIGFESHSGYVVGAYGLSGIVQEVCGCH